jgi:DUF917 family protein
VLIGESPRRGSWQIDADALESIVVGAGILGTGGGGNPYVGKLKAKRLLRQGKTIEVVPLEDLEDDCRVCAVGVMGAPTIGLEKLGSGREPLGAMQALEQHLGRAFDAVVPVEIGGGNSVEPMIVAGQAGIPVVDADGQGRAFPTMPMMTFFIYGVSCFPAAVCDDKGNTVVFTGGVDEHWLESLTRALAAQMGGQAGGAIACMTGAEAKRTAIPATLSYARGLGDRVRSARELRTRPTAACSFPGSSWTSSVAPPVASCAAACSSRAQTRTPGTR